MSQRIENQAESTDRVKQNRSGGGAGWIFIFIGLLLVIGPIAASAFLGTAAQLVLVGLGTITLVVGGAIVIISKLYVTATADRAFVRTGMGGQKIITDGGAIVIPAVHQLTFVTLETMRMEVERVGGKDALLTSDSLRADIRAEFFIRVEKQAEAVMAAAKSIGGELVDRFRTEPILRDKLISALRSTALKHTLVDLNKNRTAYVAAVQEILGEDLQKNGFTLETVTISYLDQTPMTSMNADQNIFDAEGAKMIAEIVAGRRIERNKIEREAEQEVARQDVATRKQILATEQDQQMAEAEQANQIAQARAQAQSSARSQAAEQARLAGVAEAESERAVQIAGVSRQQAVEVAEQERRKAGETAKVTAERAIEVARREQEVAVANAEADRANAQKEQLEAEAQRETAAQAVKTVAATAEAERKKSIEVIGQQAISEKDKTRVVVQAQAEATSRVTTAKAEQEAAEASAAARRTAAEADRDAQKASAEGQTAIAMVPVEVNRAQVAVTREDLANKAEFEAISSGLTQALARIDADKEVRVETAKAMGVAMAAAKITVWGDPSAVERMTRAFLGGQAVGQSIQGFEAGAPAHVVDQAKDALDGLGALASSALKRLTGVDIPVAQVEEALREEQRKASGGGLKGDKPK